ncbi:MAG: carboxypeptidase-like regulatory domain-containing protein, partial [Planctomycetota bacterium]
MRYSLIAVVTLFALLIPSAEAGEIRGVIVDANDKPVPRATVVLCGRDTGIPLDRKTFKPFTDKGFASKGIAVAVTDTEGAFSFEGVPDGKYKLVSQSWLGKPSVLDIGEVNSEQTVLHGVARRIRVPSQRATNIQIKPLGKAVVTIDEDFPNSDGYLLISTKPLSVDPILGFVSWRGPFLKNLIGANRMPNGITKIHGLPEGKIYLSIFANDNNGGIG